MKSLAEISDQKCPLCNKALASTEYDKAINGLEEKLQKNFDEQNESQRESFESEIQEIKDRYEESLSENHSNHKEQLQQLRSELEKSYNAQFEQVQKSYESISKQSEKIAKENQKQFEDLEKQLKASHKKELAEKTKEISQLEKQQQAYKKMATEKANATFKVKKQELEQKLSERDIQLNRFSDEIESLKHQLTQSQSELKGEAGELDLLSRLTESFPNDHFRRQKRGTSSGDIMQQIRTGGKSLDIPIVYDNKVAKNVTKKDVEKAKKYQKIHGTNYVLIVSANLPKTSVPNGLYGTRDGIILVHPSIVTEVTNQIRRGIIEVSKLSTSKGDQKSKQAKLYQYMMSSEFSLLLEEISMSNETLYKLQNKEEKDHQTMWKSRKQEYDKQVRLYNDFCSGIESITQTPLEEVSMEVKEK